MTGAVRATRVTGAGGVELHVVEAGERGRPPVLLVHGFAQSHVCWRRQLPLAGEFHLVAFDLRGHGESGKPGSGYADGRCWAEDVAAVIDATGAHRAVLVGWSYGGLVVTDYLRCFGAGDVAGVDFVGAITSIGTRAANRGLGRPYKDIVPGLVSADAGAAATALAGLAELCWYGSPGERAEMLGCGLVVPPRARREMLSRVADHDDVLAALAVPVLVSHGDADQVVTHATGEHTAAVTPRATLSSYPGVAHRPFAQAAARFNAELREFVRAA